MLHGLLKDSILFGSFDEYNTSGSFANVLKDSQIEGIAVSYDTIGTESQVLSCRKISATMPPFQISGNASDVLKHSRLSILQGRYDELGSSVSVLSHFGIMPEIGSHDIAIDASKLLKSSVLRAGFDWYDLSGEACNTISHFAVIAPVVGFNSFGNAIGIKRNYVLSNEVCACGIFGLGSNLASHRVAYSGLGAYSLAGYQSVFRIKHVVQSIPGMHVISGGENLLLSSRRLNAIPDDYSAHFEASSLFRHCLLSGYHGSYDSSIARGDLVFRRIFVLPRIQYSLNGISQSLTKDSILTSLSSEYRISGSISALIPAYRINATIGNCAFDVFHSSLIRRSLIDTLSTSYDVDGAFAECLKISQLRCDIARVLLDGFSSDVLAHRVVDSYIGQYVADIVGTVLQFDHKLFAGSNEYIVCAYPSDLIFDHVLFGNTALYLSTGNLASLVSSRILKAMQSWYLTDFKDLDLLAAHKLQANRYAHSVTGFYSDTIFDGVMDIEPANIDVFGRYSDTLKSSILFGSAPQYDTIGSIYTQILRDSGLPANVGVYNAVGGISHLTTDRILFACPIGNAYIGKETDLLTAHFLPVSPCDIHELGNASELTASRVVDAYAIPLSVFGLDSSFFREYIIIYPDLVKYASHLAHVDICKRSVVFGDIGRHLVASSEITGLHDCAIYSLAVLYNVLGGLPNLESGRVVAPLIGNYDVCGIGTVLNEHVLNSIPLRTWSKIKVARGIIGEIDNSAMIRSDAEKANESSSELGTTEARDSIIKKSKITWSII